METATTITNKTTIKLQLNYNLKLCQLAESPPGHNCRIQLSRKEKKYSLNVIEIFSIGNVISEMWIWFIKYYLFI